MRQPRRAQHVVRAQHRPFCFGRFRRDQLRLDAEPFRHRGGAAQLNHAVFGARDDEAAHLFPAGGMAGLPFQTGVKFGAVLVDPGQRAGGAQASDQSGRVPGCAAGQSILLQQHDLIPSELSEMIRDAATGNAAANNDDSGLSGQRGIHDGLEFTHEAFFLNARFYWPILKPDLRAARYGCR